MALFNDEIRSELTSVSGKKVRTCFWAGILLVFVQVLFASAVWADTFYVGPGESYTSIQAAVDDARDGDTIIVRNGTYTENVNVDKSLTIRSENGYSTTTVIAANSNDHVFHIMAGGATIAGFTIEGANGYYRAGIYLGSDTSQCTISNNRIGYDESHKNYHGIYLENSTGNTIANNIVEANGYHGAYVISSSHNTFSINGFNLNGQEGIYLKDSDNNRFLDNDCNENGRHGIDVRTSSDNEFINNTCSSNEEFGIRVYSSSNNNILESNECNFNRDSGIYLYSNHGNTVSGNTVKDNSGSGVSLSHSDDNQIASNFCTHNDFHGLNFYYSTTIRSTTTPVTRITNTGSGSLLH